jgi:uncharacterized membrane protein
MNSMRVVRGLVGLALVFFGLAVWLAVSGRADAATITVNPGSTIQSGVNSAAAGDTVLVKAGTYTAGVTLNRNVHLVAEPGVIVNGNNAGQAVSIQCSDCSVTGFTFNDFAYGIGADNITGRNRVTLRNNIQRRTNYGFWISGDDWIVENNEVDRIIRRDAGGDADYGRVFGNRHVIRGSWFHGTQIPTDLAPGPDYAHTDCFQFYNQNGEILRDVLIEDNVFSEFVQGLFIGLETPRSTPPIERVTVRNNVFWGTSFTPAGNLLGSPSWGIYFGKNGPTKQIVVENNTFRNCANSMGILDGTDAIVRRNIVANGGGVMILEGTAPALVTLTPDGNLLYQNQHNGEMDIAGGKASVNPQFRNAAAVNAELAGADGKIMTADDAWVALASAAVGYGAQPKGTTPPTPGPTDGIYQVTVNTAQGQSGATTLNLRKKPRPEGTLVVVGAQTRDVTAGQSVTVTYASLVTSGPAYTATTAVVGTSPAGWSVSATATGFTVNVPSSGALQTATYRATFTTAGGQVKTVDVTVRGREVALVMNPAPALVEVEEGSSVLVPWSAIVSSGPGNYTGSVAGVTPVVGVTAVVGANGVTFSAN